MPRLGLALSGGGLRATLFHLGVVRFLHDAGRLGEVTHIVSVSGGSILGAHLALNWGRYTGSAADFDEAAAKIIDFVRADARNQIARRIPFLVPLRQLQRLSPRGPSRALTPTGLLEKLYAKHLYGDARVHQLPDTPELHLLTTNVSEGGLCSFTKAGLIMQHRTPGGVKVEVLPARLASIALAVTASSAFPGFFPPPLITADDLGLSDGEFPPQTFTDGGVYDNLGVRAMDLIEDLDPSLDQIIVSDVGKTFSIIRPKPLGMIGRAMRATDILWDRVGQLEKQKFQDDPRFLFVASLDQVAPGDDPTALHAVIQSEVANVRTDIDRFSPLEITALVQHGYCVARKQCRTRPDLYGSSLPSSPPWDPMKRSDGDDPQHPPTARGDAARPGDASPPVTALVTRQAQQLRGSANRRVWSTLLDLHDWPTYVYIPLLVLLLGVLPVALYRYRRQANANAVIVDAITHGSPDFRKILEIVQRTTAPSWTPLPVQEVAQASRNVDYRGFEFLSDTSIVDLRDWRRSKSRDAAHYYRRVRIKKRGDESVFVLQYPRVPFDRIDFQGGPEKLKPVVRRIPPETGKSETTWELAFDVSKVRAGSPIDVEIEATVHDFEARKGAHENWLRYSPPAATEQASVWVLFPESRPYKDYRLIRYAAGDPATVREIESQYTIDHPYGSIIAWSIVNAEAGYVYECEWTVESPD
ncbi:patatin-like phospholipase family protein [Paludisphaera mucosa]|uniref:Patatin-like phospholipase family protein n=1 Tax=Paludisphaera mucosa TaxID=3030827 RepID=A0ABT6FLF7_9BACT|nr:patatin-like phospholipase family protein [Paludisphaera mucosa]MDG3008203.1 patatin-like phospholipase family protein [Paludisphaera mucosa]